MYTDSLDKVVYSYFAAITRKRFTYKGKVVEPHPLVVSPGIFRDYTCPAGCGGCCMRFSLIWLPFEEYPPNENLRVRMVEFDGLTHMVYEDPQTDHTSHFCRHLKSDGRCRIHGVHPFTCDFELLRVTMQSERSLLNQRLFGRGWSYTRVDGEKGAKCTITPPTPEAKAEAVRKLLRLKAWAEYFRVTHCLDIVISWVRTGPHDTPLRIDPRVTPIEDFA